jgi:hypothetical protein
MILITSFASNVPQDLKINKQFSDQVVDRTSELKYLNYFIFKELNLKSKRLFLVFFLLFTYYQMVQVHLDIKISFKVDV